MDKNRISTEELLVLLFKTSSLPLFLEKNPPSIA